MKKTLLAAILALVAILAIFFITYSIKQQKRQQESQSIVNVWNQFPTAVKAATKVMPKSGQPTLDLMRLADILAKVDCSQCPTDFQAAWLHMVKAEREIAVHANTATAVIAVLNLIKGNGAAISAVNEREADFQAALLECKQVASQHGLKFSS
jgi:uncharacterized secreted protein with C-terminal beta-propeller domain